MKNNELFTRREFLKSLIMYGFSVAAGGTLLSLIGCDSDQQTIRSVGNPTSSQPTLKLDTNTGEVSEQDQEQDQPQKMAGAANIDLAVARGSSPTGIVRAAVAALGGIEAFVKPGDDVVIKPNIVAADYSYEYAAYTNPEVVGAVTALCVGAGARRVRVMDRPVSGTCAQVYARSGIGDAVKAAGGETEIMSDFKYRSAAIPEGRDITKWTVYGDVLDADVLINLPIAKHHSLARLTLSFKNLMGVIKDRSKFHLRLGQRLADLSSLLRPELTIIDAVNILMARGPRGGNLNDVKKMDTVIASRDPIAVSSYAATFFGLAGADIAALSRGAEMGLGVLDYTSLRLEEIDV